MDYEKQGTDFLEKWGLEMSVVFLGKYIREGFASSDGKARDQYMITITNTESGKRMEFNFTQSLHCTGGEPVRVKHPHYKGHWQNELSKRVAPTAYTVLACITTMPPENVEDFIADYYHDAKAADFPRIYTAWKACMKEAADVMRVFPRESIDELNDIQ